MVLQDKKINRSSCIFEIFKNKRNICIHLKTFEIKAPKIMTNDYFSFTNDKVFCRVRFYLNLVADFSTINLML